MKRIRGAVALVRDGVEHGSRAVEHLQKETARLPFTILEQIPPLRVPVKGIHAIYDASVTGVHGMIRLVNHVVGETLDVALAAADDGAPQAEPPAG